MMNWKRMVLSLFVVVILVGSASALVTENFSDGDYTTGPITWTVNSGTWNAASFYLYESTTTDAWRTIEGALTQDSSADTWTNYSFKTQVVGGTKQHYFRWGANCTDANQYPYLTLRIQGTNQFNYVNATGTTTINNTFSATTTGGWDNVSIKHDGSGLYELFFNDGLIINQTYADTALDDSCIAVYTNDVGNPGNLFDNFIYSSAASDPISVDLDVTLNFPSNAAGIATTSITFNSTLDPADDFNLTNATLNVWYSNNSLFNQTTNLTIFQNSTTNVNYTVSGFGLGSYIWNVYGCQENSTSAVFCESADSNFTFTQGVSEINASVFEMNATQLFYGDFNLTFNTSGTAVSSNIWYGGTSTSATTTSIGGDSYKVNTSVIPTGTQEGNISFFWEIIVDGISTNTSSNEQTVGPAVLAQCNSTITVPYMNFTFANETSSAESITSSLSSTWNYYGDSSSIYKTLSFSNATENNWYGFCFDPPSKTIKTNVSLTYDNALSEQRSYVQSILTLTNTSTNQLLSLLPTADGIFVTFQVVNLAEQNIAGTFVNATKSGSLITSGFTDDAGTVTFFLDPDTIYVFNFFDSSYDLFTTTLQPTQTSYTITLGGTTTTANDYTKGISYSILPTGNLVNDTTTPFNFTLTSSSWTVTSFGFTLTNGSGQELGTATTIGNGGIASTSVGTSNYTSIIMDYYWVIGGNRTNASTSWRIFDSTGSGYGLKNFFTRLSLYKDQGMFGLNSWSLTLIIFLMIFGFAGMLSLKLGSRLLSPVSISITLLLMVIFFDVVLGLVPTIPKTAENLHVPSLIAVLIGAWILIREART